MPPRKSRDKEVQPAQAEHADDSPLHSKGENDPITFLPVSPLAKRSYGNPVFKEKEADRGGDFAESSNVFRGMTERLDLAFKEQNQAMRRLVDSQTESSKRQEELVRQCIEEMRRVFEEGTRVMQETGEESRRTLQAVSEQVVEQVRQPRPEIPPPVVEMPRQIQEAPIPALGGQGNQPHPNIQQQNFFMGEGQRQHEPMEAAAPVADHGHQPQHRYVPPGRRGNVGPHHQPYPRDFFQPQVLPAQPVQRGLQNHPAQLFNRDQLIDLVQETHEPALRPLVRPSYMKPYPDIIDHENPFPRGFKVPEFTLFSGEVALTWYLSLPQNSVYSWRQMEDLFHTQFYRCEPEVSMADLSRLAQKPGELFEAFLARFRRARLKCRVALPEQEFVKLAQNGLDIELRKKFEGMEFRDFYELSYKVARYENLLKEDIQKKAASHGTYYSDPNFDLDVAEVVADKPVVCPDLVRPTHQPETSVRRYVGEAGKQYTFDVSKASDIFDHLKKSGLIKLPPRYKIPTAAEIEARDYCKFHNSWKHSTDNCLIFRNILQEKIDKGILKFPDKAKETIGVDADPFPAMSVGVNVADLRSVARNRSLPYAQRNLAAEDLRWVLEAQRSRQSRSVRLDQQRLGGQERIAVTRNFSLEGARRYSTGTRSPRMVKLPLRLPSRRWEKVNHPKFPAQNPRTLRHRLQRKRAEERKRQQKQVEAEGSSSRRPRQPTKRNMVWVRKQKNETVTQTLQKEDDQSSASPKVASVIVSLDGVLKATFEAQEQSRNRGSESKEDGTIHFGEFLVNLSCLVLTLPLVFQAKKEEEPIICEFPEQTKEEVIVVPAQDDEEEDMADKIVFEKPEEKMARHIRPLYINAHMDGTPISRVLDMIGKFMEIYIDDVVVKSNGEADHLVHLRKSFERMRQHGLKMNPLKCAFGVSTGNFLGYLVHERGLEVDKNKARAVIEAKPPQNKKELQRLIGQVNFLRRFISNLAGKTKVFSPLLKRKSEADFKWEEHHQFGFDMIKAVKGQALADFLADHPCLDVEADEEKGINLFLISLVPWKLIFYGSSTETMAGAGVVVISPSGLKTQMSFQLDFDCTNNQAEYEALIIGLEMLVELKVSMVEVIGDSQLVLKQLSGEYKCTSLALAPYFALAVQLLEEFDDVSIRHMSRDQNYEANEMAQIASGLRIPEGVMQKVMLSDVHDGICGAHQAEIKMRWLIRRHGFFWPSVLKDCIAYAKGCKSYQIHGPLQRVPASELNSIVKPWPFRGWAIDLIGKVYPPSSKGHSFIIVATDYFTKWVEAKPMKKVDQSDVIKFIKEDIIHRFGLPETITTDQGTVFVRHQVKAFAKEMGFRLLNSTPHYAQANGQAEASNKVVINLLEKMVDDNPRRWHELLSETLWVYRTSQRSSTKMTPFALTYGHDAILPMELTARSLRMVIQHNLQSGEYDKAMMLELEDFEDSRLTALDRLQAQKLKIAKSYNKRVKGKNLAVGDLVWKVILPLWQERSQIWEMVSKLGRTIPNS
ncbi:hypothetical protein SLEP1_g50628 [Rubroshorea leprosula]|uniref:Uncharacterized protein n=1 Tax=Rubroshorea leprosula TaxID=152421 RepID=A0AAV5M0M6_9ROSI|nr:hypothetical protein SLEP1_g50628 [Rubroshorea leprosula]